MLLRINTISNFTRIKKFSWHRDTNDFKRINLIYGGNGVGKTTITNLIRLYSNEADVIKSDIIEKHKNGDEFNLEIVASSGDLKIDKKQQKHNLKILVFNQSFVEDHVFNGKSINAKGFADVATQDQLSNPTIKKLSDSLKIADEKQKKATADTEKLDKQFTKQKAKVSAYINDRVKAFRMPPVPNLSSLSTLTLEDIQNTKVEEIEKLCKDFNVVNSQESLDEEIKKIKLFQLTPLDGSFIASKETLNRSILANARNRVREIVDSMPTQSNNWGKWYENGKVLLETFVKENKNECPLCGGTEVQIMDIVGVLNDFFSDEWKTITSELKDFRNLIQNVESGSETVFENVTLLNNSLKKIKRDGVDTDVIMTLKKKIKDNLEALDIVCSNKEKDLSKVLSGAELLLLNSSDQLMTEMNTRVLEIQKEFKILVKEIDESFLSKEVIEAKIKSKAKLLVVKYMIDDGASNSLFEEYAKAHEEGNSSKLEYAEIQLKLTEEIKKLKAEAKLINNHLKNLSFFNFSVDFDSESESGLSINYENGNTKKELSFALSEGEKTGLSFAYFLSKVQYEVLSNPDEDKENFIVLIDDPISSLDDKRLYTTSFVIKEFFKDFSQIFVLSHNLNFLKFFGSVVAVGDRSDYLIEFSDGNLSLKNAPLALTNYGTTYFLKLQDLIKYKARDLTYDDAKKFLPTHCRIVLESFLSFKFFLLSKRGSDRFKTPGLDRIIGLLESQSGSYKHFKEVNGISFENICSKLEYIKRLTDSHSHGGNHLFDEFMFITEDELNELCDDTLSIICFFDNIHYEKISAEEVSA